MFLLFIGLVLLLIWVLKLQNRLNELETENRRQAGRIVALDARLSERLSQPPAAAEAPAPSPRTAPPPLQRVPSPAARQGIPSPQAAVVGAGAGLSRPSPPSRIPPPAPPPPPPQSASFDWEGLIGVKLFSWIAGIALALGAIFFLRYSIQSGWLQPPVRMAIGLVTGVGLLVGCELRAARRYAVTSNALDASGLVILFSTVFASHALWGLLGVVPAFTLLSAVTVVAVLLSIRRDSVFVALLGLVGGFATPALLSTGQDNPLGLFGYLLLLNAGLAWVASYRRWVVLVALSLVFTTFYQWGWVFSFLTPEKLPLAIAIFLAFPALAWGLLLARGTDAEGGEPFITLAAVNATLPFLFLLFVATKPALSVPPWLFLATLFALGAALAALALYVRRGAQHLAATVAAQVIVITWVLHAPDAPWPLVAMAAAAGVAALSLGWSWLARRTAQSQRATFDSAAAAGVLLGQLAVVFAAAQGTPGVLTVTLFHVAFLLAALWLAAWSEWLFLAPLAVVPAAMAMGSWQEAHPGPTAWRQALALSTPLYLLFIAYPLALGRRAGRALWPHLAAVLASAVFFLVARDALLDGGYEAVLGVLPLVQAALVGVLLAALLRLEPAGQRTLGRLAMVAGTVLALVTVAIPLQLEHQWLTLGWALEGAALAWLYTRIPHRGLLWWSLALLSAVFVRLAVNPEVLVYQERGSLRILNWYLYTYATAAASMLVAARWLSRTDDRVAEMLPSGRTLLSAGATALLFLLLNIEIADFYATGPYISVTFGASLAQDLTYTLGWAAFAVALLVVGIVIESHAARLSAILLLTVTVLKGFLYDVSRLGGLYRVMSFVGLAICLALVAIVLQRFVLSSRPRSEHTSAHSG